MKRKKEVAKDISKEAVKFMSRKYRATDMTGWAINGRMYYMRWTSQDTIAFGSSKPEAEFTRGMKVKELQPKILEVLYLHDKRDYVRDFELSDIQLMYDKGFCIVPW